jgi:hypothetical protein
VRKKVNERCLEGKQTPYRSEQVLKEIQLTPLELDVSPCGLYVEGGHAREEAHASAVSTDLASAQTQG